MKGEPHRPGQLEGRQKSLELLESQVVIENNRFAHIRRRIGIPSALFSGCVLLPTLVALIYFGLVASDVYISESDFVVRSPGQESPTGLGSLLQGTGLSHAPDDTFSVQDFVLSRDALRQLDAKLHVKAAFSSGNVDPVNRFAAFGRDDSFEALYEYYLKHIQVDYDSDSSIVKLRVRAYNGQDAQRINELLLEMSEDLVNKLNERSQQDLITVAQKEVSDGEQRALSAALALSNFRSSRAVFDPNGQSAMQLESVTKMREELINAEGQLAALRRLTPQNPQIVALSTRTQGLRDAIAAEDAKVTGNSSASLSAKAPAYDQLVLEKAFADRQLEIARTSLESARSEAARKQRYLERLVQPSQPDKAMEPRRMRSIGTVLILGLMVWAVVSLIVASVREHTD